MKYLALVLFLIALVIALFNIWSGSFSFWYDNARDLLTAWEHITSPTLIGPPSGIPGIFYGPYWIWFLSLGLLFSKDPRVVITITALIPYFVIFPFIWFKFNKFFSTKALLIGWVFFIFSSGMIYATQLWNPYPAPILTLATVYLLLINNWKKQTKKQLLQAGLLGFLLALIINFHIAFGIGFILGVSLFLISTLLLSFRANEVSRGILIQKLWKNILLFLIALGSGFILAFIPFLLFEIRHGFSQTQTILTTASQYGAVVDIAGLTKQQILREFVITFGKLLALPFPFALGTILFAIGWIIFLATTKKITFSKGDRTLLLLLACLFGGIGFIYFTARNPVWAYHFIGVDIYFLLLFTFLISKSTFLLRVSALWTIVVVISQLIIFFHSVFGPPLNFAQEKKTVETIIKDTKTNEFTVFAYNPSIYSYQYTYLFKWLAGKDVPYDPAANPSDALLQYLIIPEEQTPQVVDFTHFRSPDEHYKTTQTWEDNGLLIIKRERRQLTQ